jgi:hypothetical protein
MFKPKHNYAKRIANHDNRRKYEMFDNCNDFLATDDLQFGFKAIYGCSNAVFALRSTTDYFQNHGRFVFAASLDIGKAFDTLNHYKLSLSV